MNIHQKINAKGNREVFYTTARQSGIILIKRNYRIPYQDINLPQQLFLKSEYGSNYKGH